MDEYRRSNREKRMQPRLAKAWCDCCDRYYGPVYGKCPVCGYKDTSKLRKEKNAR